MDKNESLFSPLEKTQEEGRPLEEMHFPSKVALVFRQFVRSRTASGSLLFVLVLLWGAIFIPVFSSHTYYENHLQSVNAPPSTEFWFGTDELGRDIFVRVWSGARISLGVGIGSAIIDLVLGILFGGISGYFGGWIDEVMMRVIDALDGVPTLLKAMALRCLFRGGFFTVLFIIALVSWCRTARIVRFQVLQCKHQDFVLAAKAIGANKRHIFFFHILPNIWGPLIVSVTLSVPSAIFGEGFLSFLGMGVDLPVASWGSMASSGLAALRYYPWRLFFPIIFIFMTMLAFNWIGDGLRDALDPRGFVEEEDPA
ncbi:ABC transporter permease [Candidatus Similichlamydia laticola]|uniref:Oligopeptide transport system permease protein OppC n=1 Tax=Candidatus Similichlamydia laticola TaxID=2170265 RepID=A0A369KAF0_9BACT|nr:ABC transporter permease [Candidatus Similichlamydia laticola]RDB31579.1 Oligopeptide transport system permease protein OppC [Candidatus Similichlamydia laticola]